MHVVETRAGRVCVRLPSSRDRAHELNITSTHAKSSSLTTPAECNVNVNLRKVAWHGRSRHTWYTPLTAQMLVLAALAAAPTPNATEWCCFWCSAGGCSAEYSPTNENVPIDAGGCIHGGTITQIDPMHGNNCGPENYCCSCCSAGGCSAWYSIKDEQQEQQ